MVLLFAEQNTFGSRCSPFVMNIRQILTAGVDFMVFLTCFCFSKFSFLTVGQSFFKKNTVNYGKHSLRCYGPVLGSKLSLSKLNNPGTSRE